MRESNIPLETILDPVLALSSLTMLFEAPSAEDGTVGEDRAARVPSVAPSAEVRIRAEVAVESKQSAFVLAIPPAERSQVQSSSDFPTFSSTGCRSEIGRRRQ